MLLVSFWILLWSEEILIISRCFGSVECAEGFESG